MPAKHRPLPSALLYCSYKYLFETLPRYLLERAEENHETQYYTSHFPRFELGTFGLRFRSARQRFGKNVIMTTHVHTTVEELLEAALLARPVSYLRRIGE
jgi:hypothetical protein